MHSLPPKWEKVAILYIVFFIFRKFKIPDSELIPITAVFLSRRIRRFSQKHSYLINSRFKIQNNLVVVD